MKVSEKNLANYFVFKQNYKIGYYLKNKTIVTVLFHNQLRFQLRLGKDPPLVASRPRIPR